MKAAFNFIYRLANNENLTDTERLIGCIAVPVLAIAVNVIGGLVFNTEVRPWR